MQKKLKPTKDTLLDSWGINRTSEQLNDQNELVMRMLVRVTVK